MGFQISTPKIGFVGELRSCCGALGVGVSAVGTAQSRVAQDSGADARSTRGKKLVLKDGTFQMVRSYEKNGDRVRYFSLERGGWEEIPASLVDWDATAKAEKDTSAADDALAAKIHKQEEERKIETTLDVDASLQVGGGSFFAAGRRDVCGGRKVGDSDSAGGDGGEDGPEKSIEARVVAGADYSGEEEY